MRKRLFHPESVVTRLSEDLQLSEDGKNRVRLALKECGVNKALLQRRLLIRLKHAVKIRLKSLEPGTPKHLEYQRLNTRMQQIAKLDKDVVWPDKPKKLNRVEHSVVVGGGYVDWPVDERKILL